jgi:hypothetical protein
MREPVVSIRDNQSHLAAGIAFALRLPPEIAYQKATIIFSLWSNRL